MIDLIPNDPMTPPYTDRCRCTACGEYFRSSSAFGRHRYSAKEGRRCLSVPQMLEKGMVKSDTGHWMASRRDVKAVGRIRREAIGTGSVQGEGDGADGAGSP